MDKNQVHPDSSLVNKTDEEWKKILPADVFYVAQTKRNGKTLYEQV